ncbi:MAG: hypothetical protein ACI837_000189 [Crocinitomicaceae bacterium]|jgi:hypothetical protein
MAKKKSFWERFALSQLSGNVKSSNEDQLFILTNSELAALQKIRMNTYLKVGIAGAFGVVLLYLPYHLFGETLFPKRDVWIPFYENYIELEIEFIIYSIVLVFTEIWFLTYTNIKAVSAIATACGTVGENDPNYNENMNALINVGLEKKQKSLSTIGIDPYEGLSKWSVLIFQTLLKLKAAISGFLWKLLVTKLLGRYAFRMLVDLLGAPLYAVWNIWGSRKIMHEARVRVMAPPLIYKFTELLHAEFKGDKSFNKVIYSTLQAISTSKRSFHYNHFLLATSILTKFDIPIEDDPYYDPDFLEKVDDLAPAVQVAVAKLLVFGIMIDGGLSSREKKSLIQLKDENVLPYTVEEVKKWSVSYFEGRGLEDFFAR